MHETTFEHDRFLLNELKTCMKFAVCAIFNKFYCYRL